MISNGWQSDFLIVLSNNDFRSKVYRFAEDMVNQSNLVRGKCRSVIIDLQKQKKPENQKRPENKNRNI